MSARQASDPLGTSSVASYDSTPRGGAIVVAWNMGCRHHAAAWRYLPDDLMPDLALSLETSGPRRHSSVGTSYAAARTQRTRGRRPSTSVRARSGNCRCLRNIASGSSP